MIAEQRADSIEIALLQRVHHRFGQLAHAAQRLEDGRVTALVGAENGGDRVSGDARLSGIYQDGARAQVVACGGVERDAPYRRRALERERESAAMRCGVMVLPTARDAKLLDLERSSGLRDPGAIDGLPFPRGDGGEKRCAQRR